MLLARRADPLPPGGVHVSHHTCWPWDLDAWRELSNGRGWQLSLAITNAADEDPPVIPGFDQRFSSQTNPANA